jgi:hypothetical protein
MLAPVLDETVATVEEMEGKIHSPPTFIVTPAADSFDDWLTQLVPPFVLRIATSSPAQHATPHGYQSQVFPARSFLQRRLPSKP